MTRFILVSISGYHTSAAGVDLSGSNMDTPLGRKSLRRMYDAIMLESESLPPGVKLEDVYCDHPVSGYYLL
jgi:hypothetical protein